MAALPQHLQNAYARLSLPAEADADAKSVKRAYAAALKQIDQESQAEAFENLRAAYETAMAWARQHAERAALPLSAPAAPAPEPAPTAPGPDSATTPPALDDAGIAAPPPDADAPSTVPTTPPIASAVQIEAALREWITRLTDRSLTHPGALIAEARQDERLISLAAQETLETRLAAVLAHDPWERERLFEAAVAHFHWDTNNGGQLPDRWTAAWIVQACSESLLWRAQSERDRLRQIDAINAALASPVPSEDLLYRHYFAMEELTGNFGYWLSLRIPNYILQAWSQAYHAPGFKRPPTPPVPKPRIRWRPTPRMALFLALLVMSLLRIVFYPDASPSASYDRTSPAFPSNYTLRDAALDGRLRDARMIAASVEESRPERIDPSMTRYAGAPPRPIYPAVSRQKHEEGLVTVRVDANADGVIMLTQVERSSGHPLLDEAALRSLTGVRLQPYIANGKPVPISVLVPFDFRLNDGPAR